MTALAQRALSARNTAPVVKTFTTEERRQIVTAAFKTFGAKTLPSLVEVERTNPKMLDRQTTDRTILSVAVAALNAAGDKTEKTVGAIRGKLDISQDKLDLAFCHCVNGAEISGDRAAARMANLG